MHSYSIDTQERINILLLLAIISIVLAWGFYKVFDRYQIVLPWWAESPSVLSCYGLLFIIFDRRVWRFFRRINFIKTPELSGEWNGSLKTSFDKHSSEIKATLRIFQTWTRIKIILCTEYSSSHSEIASIVVDAPEGKYLSYQYINEPKADAGKTMSIHRGTARLLYNEKDNTLNGEYYSGRNRQNFGSLNFKKIVRK